MEKKRHRITIRLTDEELNKIREKAKKKGLTISDLFRQSVLGKSAVRRKQKIDCNVVKILAYEINKVGVNINQIAKGINTTGEIDIQVLESLLNIEYTLAEILKMVGYEEKKN